MPLRTCTGGRSLQSVLGLLCRVRELEDSLTQVLDAHEVTKQHVDVHVVRVGAASPAPLPCRACAHGAARGRVACRLDLLRPCWLLSVLLCQSCGPRTQSLDRQLHAHWAGTGVCNLHSQRCVPQTGGVQGNAFRDQMQEQAKLMALASQERDAAIARCAQHWLGAGLHTVRGCTGPGMAAGCASATALPSGHVGNCALCGRLRLNSGGSLPAIRR